jgi:hypothetical protein
VYSKLWRVDVFYSESWYSFLDSLKLHFITSKN